MIPKTSKSACKSCASKSLSELYYFTSHVNEKKCGIPYFQMRHN